MERAAQHTTRSQVHHRQEVPDADGESQQELARQYRANEAGVPAVE